MTVSRSGSSASVARSVSLAGCALAAGLFVAMPGQMIGLVTIAAGGTMTLLALTNRLIRWEDDASAARRIGRWTMASFAIHLAVGLAIVNSRSAMMYLGPDAFGYDAFARAIVAHWTHGGPMPALVLGKEGYYFLLSSVYWIFRPSTWAGVALNAALVAALIPIISDTTYRLFGRAATRYIPGVLLLVPGMVLWPSQLLKEAPFFLLLAVAGNCSARLVLRYSPMPWLLLAGVLPCLLWFRAQLGLAVMAGVIVGIVIGRREFAVGLAGGVVAIGLVAGSVALGVGSSGYQTAVSSNLEQANIVRQGFATDVASGFGSGADISSAHRALSFLPIGIVSVALGPFPWQLRGLRQLAVVPDVIAWWLVVAACWWGQKAARRLGREWLALATPGAATMSVIALIVGNYGTVVRERMQILVLLSPIIALGMTEWRARGSWRSRSLPIPAVNGRPG